jgi:hypothetical protein
VRSRRVGLGAERRAVEFERVEGMRRVDYRIERSGDTLALRRRGGAAAADAPIAMPQAASLPAGLALLRVEPVLAEGAQEAPIVPIRIVQAGQGASRALQADLPREALRRVVLGRAADLTPGRALAGLDPGPPALTQAEAVMALAPPHRWRPPWDAAPEALAGEEDPVRLARALSDWWRQSPRPGPPVVVGVDAGSSPQRWAAAPRPAGSVLLLPSDAFPEPYGALRDELARAWSPGRVISELGEDPGVSLVVLASAEPPGLFGARLRGLARSPSLGGRLLVAWLLSGPVRPDLPGSLLADGRLAGLALAEDSLEARRHASRHLAELAAALGEGLGAGRPERLPGPFLWFF